MPPLSSSFRIPDWANPQNASVLDSPLQKAVRTLGQFIGAADPVAQVMGIAAPVEVPSGGLSTLRAYHGTRSASIIGDAIRPSTGGEFGPGIYLSQDPNMADFYASHVARGPDGPAIMPVDVQLKNPFRVTKTDWIKMTQRSTPSQVQKRLQAMGYDGIVGVGLTGQEQIVAFHPSQVASPFKKQ
jgi:hypothetical protein